LFVAEQERVPTLVVGVGVKKKKEEKGGEGGAVGQGGWLGFGLFTRRKKFAVELSRKGKGGGKKEGARNPVC